MSQAVWSVAGDILGFIASHLFLLNTLFAIAIVFSETRAQKRVGMADAFIFYTGGGICVLSASWGGYAQA